MATKSGCTEKEEELLNGFAHHQLVYDLFVNGEYYRTFSNDIQVNEASKRIMLRNPNAVIVVVPEWRDYVEINV